MPKDERERIGPFVVTTAENIDDRDITCAMCGTILAKLMPDGTHQPSPVELVASGRVPVPNFGWFCDQKCASDYERRFAVAFRRDQNGNVSYP